MILLIFVAALGVSFGLQEQARRHQIEQRFAAERARINLPPPAPRIPMLESWLTIAVGLILLATGILFFLTSLHAPTGGADQPGWMSVVAFLLASGIALIVVGWKSARQNLEHRRNKKAPL